MGLLSSPEGGGLVLKVVRAMRARSGFFALLVYVVGTALFGAVMWPAFNQGTYFSENALLPGLVQEEFSDSKGLLAILETLRSTAIGKRLSSAQVLRYLDEFGLDTFSHNFTYSNPFDPAKYTPGENIYGIIRAGRSSSTESLVILTSLHLSNAASTSILLSLAKFARQQVYWAKDVIFLFVDDAIGVQAWLLAYHDLDAGAIRVGSLRGHAGAIQAAVALEMTGMEATHADVRYQMINGQLPNLDFFNLANRMLEKFGVEPTVYHRKNPVHSYTLEGYEQFVRTAARGLAAQATGHGDGLHAPFGQFGIEALTIAPWSPSKKTGIRPVKLTQIAQILEGVLRSVNNLLERFHQSYFFYILTSTEVFASIGQYMPAIGAFVLAPLLCAICLWMDMQDEFDAIEEASPKESSVGATVLAFVIAHVLGVTLWKVNTSNIALISTPLFDLLGDSLPLLPSFGTLLLIESFFCLVLFMQPFFPSKAVDRRLLRCFALLELGLLVGVASVFNAGLGFALAFSFLPVSTFASIASRSRFVRPIARLALVTVGNPLVLVFIFSVANVSGGDLTLRQSFSAIVDGVREILEMVIVDEWLFGSWIFRFLCLTVTPVWLLLGWST